MMVLVVVNVIIMTGLVVVANEVKMTDLVAVVNVVKGMGWCLRSMW